MIVGVDLDNTIVSYDTIIHQVALERGLIRDDVPVSKRLVRDRLRADGHEDAWTEIQGVVYGSRMKDALPFPGAVECLRTLRASGTTLFLISHRTRQPYRGEAYDLHAAARGWLGITGLAGGDNAVFPDGHVFLEESKAAKAARITQLGCTHMIDDLSEFLLEDLTTPGVVRILFDPSGQTRFHEKLVPCKSWDEMTNAMQVGSSTNVSHLQHTQNGNRVGL